MRAWLTSVCDDLRANFWFVPAMMIGLAILLSQVTLKIDRETAGTDWVASLGWTFSRGPEGSRAVLSTIAGSMMTITSVAFSITIVALQLASSQFGPRLLRNFMRDRVNQFALGTFIGTFTYCLLVLRSVNGTERELFVPHFSVTVGLLMALASLGVLIYFFHHAASSIQADNVIAAVTRDLHQAIDRLYPDRVGEEKPRGAAEDPMMPPDDVAAPVEWAKVGYIQVIDLDRLISLARDRDALIEIMPRPGLFVAPGDPLARVWPGSALDDDLAGEIRGAFFLGGHRNLAQDVEFAIDQLVEVALRALSPGINDPFTAIACIDRLGEALRDIAGRELPSPFRRDDEGRLRLIAPGSTIDGITDAAFHQIRQAASGNTAVTLRLLETLAAIARRTTDPAFLAALGWHAALVHRCAERALEEPADRAEAAERFARAIEAGATPPASAD